jgi:hypothetical protein
MGRWTSGDEKDMPDHPGTIRFTIGGSGDRFSAAGFWVALWCSSTFPIMHQQGYPDGPQVPMKDGVI